MADERLPLLRGRITSVETYKAPQPGGGSPAPLPSVDPARHHARLIQQFDAITRQIASRPEGARDAIATREIVAVHPAAETSLVPDQLDGKEAWLVGVVPETGAVLLDVADASLGYLRDKVDAFADDSKVVAKENPDGTPKLDAAGAQIIQRKSEKAVGPIDTIGLATSDDIRGATLRSATLDGERPYWFEIACRGGYHRDPAFTANSRGQIARQLHRLGITHRLDEFVGPAQVYFFVRATWSQLDSLRAATDCMYEVDLAPPPLRDLQLLEHLDSREVKAFQLAPPPENAPAIVILDTGIATAHPLLRTAILSATTAGPDIPSPEDRYGHGTKMAGLALYRDLGDALERGSADATHWLQSSRLLVAPGQGTASDENYERWPVLTSGAIRSAEDGDPVSRDRVFALAVTRTMQGGPREDLGTTLWSHAIDQLAYRDGDGRLLVVSAGNARGDQWVRLAEQHPELQLSEKIHEPAQAANVLTVGAFTARVEMPKSTHYVEARAVATRPGGISPYTSTGLVGNDQPIKPDVVLEGGNLAISGLLPDASVPTLSALTTHYDHTFGRPLSLLSMTSEATARAAHLAARVWALEPKLRPETVRALIVHSATWTQEMLAQFPGIDDRLRACGYGVPDESIASECTRRLATVIIEESIPNAVVEEEPKKDPPKRPTTKTTESVNRRKVKLYRLPIPDSLIANGDTSAELRVTLSYFAEPNKFGRRTTHGLDLKWHMQGPQETEDQFLQRINTERRPKDAKGRPTSVPKTSGFVWEVGVQRRSRGTVQSDRWRGNMSALVGDKLIAVVPVLGWWDQTPALRHQDLKFSLVVSVFGSGVYDAIKPHVVAAVPVPIEV